MVSSCFWQVGQSLSLPFLLKRLWVCSGSQSCRNSCRFFFAVPWKWDIASPSTCQSIESIVESFHLYFRDKWMRYCCVACASLRHWSWLQVIVLSLIRRVARAGGGCTKFDMVVMLVG